MQFHTYKSRIEIVYVEIESTKLIYISNINDLNINIPKKTIK